MHDSAKLNTRPYFMKVSKNDQPCLSGKRKCFQKMIHSRPSCPTMQVTPLTFSDLFWDHFHFPALTACEGNNT